MNKRTLFIVITAAMILLIVLSAFVVSIYIRNELAQNLIVQYGSENSVVVSNIEQLLLELFVVLCVVMLLIFLFFVWIIMIKIFKPMEIVDKAKSEFVSLASHQLRTPLSAINWYTEMLLAGDAGALNDEQKKYLDEVYKGNQRMVELVNALLDVSRLELGTFVMEPKPTDVTKLIQSVVEEQISAVNSKKIQLHPLFESNLPLVQIDPKLLRMVIQNLLSNSVKYTPEGGTINLKISSDNKKDIFIKISDTGYGIPKSQRNKIFGKLFRADNVREKDTEGTGLGLYIVKSIVEQTGGKIWFDSEENKGTTFSIILPIEGPKGKKIKVKS